MRRVDATASGTPPSEARAAAITVVRAESAGGLDRALELAVGPAVAERDATWSFLRWVDARGPQLRILVEGADAAAFRRAVVERLPEVAGAAPRTSVLPLPASQRVATGWAVEPMDGDAVPSGPLHHAVCTAVVDALRSLGDGTARLGFALAAVRCVPGVEDLDWSGIARDLTGAGEHAERVVSRLAPRASALAPALERAAGEAAGGEQADALELVRAALAEVDDPDVAAEHAHLLCNRLGVNPLEEIALALILAGADTDAPRDGERPGEDADDDPAGDADRVPDEDARADSDDVPETGVAADPEDSSGAPEDDARTGDDGPGDPGGAAEDGVDDDPPRRRKAVVRLRGVTAGGDDGPAVDDLTLTVRRGEVFGVLAEDAGVRSTVLSLAAGRRHPSAGRVRILGRDPRAERDETVRDVGVPEVDDALSPGLSVRENVAALTDGASDARVEEALRRTGLLDDAGRRIDELGPGHRRRTAVACALARDLEVLALDDPTGDLSAVDREAVWTILDGRRRAGETTILSTGSIQEAIELCDRVAFLSGDAPADVGRPARIAEQHFPLRELHLRVEEAPDPALLRDLPEVDGLDVEERPGHWIVRLDARQPDALRRLLEADPDFPPIATAETFAADDQHENDEATTG
jgi:ABC-2 type transport system ATP-binding protein